MKKHKLYTVSSIFIKPFTWQISLKI